MTQRHSRSRKFALIGAGLFTVAMVVVAGLSMTTDTLSADGTATVVRSGAVAVRPPAPTPPSGRILGPGCPPGTVLIMWEKPIYDAEGLFVIDWELVPACIDEDLEPAG